MDKVKVIREYIDEHISKGHAIKLYYEDVLSDDDYESSYLYVRGTSPIEIISTFIIDDSIDITMFEQLFNGHHGLNPTLVASYENNQDCYNEYIDLIDKININTLEIKQLDIQIY